MGMYTEFHFNAELRELPPALGWMVRGEAPDPDALPDHPLFLTDRWRFMLHSDSYYFASPTRSEIVRDDIGGPYLSVRCNLKNYCNEIALFVDWITPYVEAGDGELLGFLRHEEADLPDLIFHPNKIQKISVQPDH